jgi:hypothetical protein
MELLWWVSLKQIDYLEDLDVGERIILKYNLKKLKERLWTGLIWFRIGISSGFLKRGQ